MAAYLRERLHLSAAEGRRLQRRGRTLRTLDDLVLDDAAAGQLRGEHLDELGYGLTVMGEESMRHPTLAERFLETARTADPTALRAEIKTIHQLVLPEALEQAYVDGLDRKDLKISAVGDGYAITGFLPIELGAKLSLYLSSTTMPRTLPDGVPDERTAAERRLDALESMVDAVLANGLPVDRGFRPHLSVLMDHETLLSHVRPTDQPVQPAHLVGFGPIGHTLAEQLLCDSDITPILLSSTTHQPLDVAATKRHGQPWMRRAINAQQGDCCAAPGCTNRIGHLHHVVPWSEGGLTTFANMMGLCGSCHRLVHTGRLRIDPDTHAFTRPSGVTYRVNPANTHLRERRMHRRLSRLFTRAA